MKKIKSLALLLFIIISLTSTISFADELENAEDLPNEASETENKENLTEEIKIIPVKTSYTEAAINIDSEIEINKSIIFDASQSFLSNPELETKYEWNFGDDSEGTMEGVEVLHTYKEAGNYEVTLTITNGEEVSTKSTEIFAYKKLLLLLTDSDDAKNMIGIYNKTAEENGTFIKTIDSFGSSTEFISEEILTKKLSEQAKDIEKAQEIVIWTKENAALNAISRYIQNTQENPITQKTLIVITKNIDNKINRIQRQFEPISAKQIIVTQEATLNALISAENDEEFIKTLNEKGYNYEIINEKSGKIKAWNFMQHFVNILINNGIPDNTIALLLLLPVIATVVAFMRQVVGITTFGIYTPSIITLSFLVIGISAGLMTLVTAIIVGSITRPLLKKMRMLFIPKMAIVICLVSLSLFLILIISINLSLFDATFLSIAIFPMLILSTLVEKFVSAKSDKNLMSAIFLMGETLIVSIVAYFIAGGEINIGIAVLKFELIKNLMMNVPETVFLLLLINFGLGKWTGLRIMERIRFREILRHIEE